VRKRRESQNYLPSAWRDVEKEKIDLRKFRTPGEHLRRATPKQRIQEQWNYSQNTPQQHWPECQAI
jgi:hypothetical protein